MSRYFRTYGEKRQQRLGKNRASDVGDGVSAADLMEDESLADVAPAAGGRSVVEEEQKQQQQDDAAGGVDGIDHEHHHQAAEDAQQAGVPGKELEGRPVKQNSH